MDSHIFWTIFLFSLLIFEAKTDSPQVNKLKSGNYNADTMRNRPTVGRTSLPLIKMIKTVLQAKKSSNKVLHLPFGNLPLPSQSTRGSEEYSSQKREEKEVPDDEYEDEYEQTVFQYRENDKTKYEKENLNWYKENDNEPSVYRGAEHDGDDEEIQSYDEETSVENEDYETDNHLDDEDDGYKTVNQNYDDVNQNYDGKKNNYDGISQNYDVGHQNNGGKQQNYQNNEAGQQIYDTKHVYGDVPKDLSYINSINKNFETLYRGFVVEYFRAKYKLKAELPYVRRR